MNFNTPDITPGDRADLSWRQINEARAGARYLDLRRGPMRDIIAPIRRPNRGATNGMFPFKVYLAMIAFDNQTFTATYGDPTTWWRIFLVRAGRVGGIVMYGGGSDGYDTDPHSDFFSATGDDGNSVAPIVVPADSDPYYLWIEVLADGTPKLRQGVDPSDDPDSVQQWTTFPTMDCIHWAIAEITTTDPYEATVRQILNADLA